MKVDCVVKLGGSLLYDFTKAKKLLDKLESDMKGHIVVTVGSGALGELYKDFISDLDYEISYQNSVKDFANIQSINASILVALNQNYVVCENDEQVSQVLGEEGIPIIDSRGFLSVFATDKHQRGDVRAANICHHFNCHNLIIITNVSGIYDKDPNKHENSHIIEHVTVDTLKTMGRTAVDDGLAEKIEAYNLNCYVLGVDNVVKVHNAASDDLLKTGTIIEGREKKYEKNNKSCHNWLW